MSGRRDRNHEEIADAFRRLGWYVRSTHEMGGGFPDLLIAKAGRMRLVEVKDGLKVKSRRALRPNQVDVHRDLEAAGCPVFVVESVDDVIAITST